MEKFWKVALSIGGLAAIGAFVFWSLYEQWLSLNIFSNLTPVHTFEIMKIFLYLTFISFFLMIITYIVTKNTSKPHAVSPNINSESKPKPKSHMGLNDYKGSENISFERYLQLLMGHSTEAISVIQSHPSSEKILKDLYELHRSAKFPCEMSINGEYLDNPIYDNLPEETINTLIDEYKISHRLKYRIMPEDLYLVKASDKNNQTLLLQYFSDTELSGWQSWLFPHGFQIQETNLKDRLLLDARDFEKLIGLNKFDVEVEYMPKHEYLVSFKPDFGYKDKLVAYCFLFCSVSIKNEYPELMKKKLYIRKGEHQRQFKWFYPEELQNEKSNTFHNLRRQYNLLMSCVHQICHFLHII